MSAVSKRSRSTPTLISGLFVGLALGFVMQRGRFCVTGAFRDIWVTRNTRWLTAFLVVVAVQSAGIFALDAAGVITLTSGAFPWLATIIGGFIFGFAIIFAGGCTIGNAMVETAQFSFQGWTALVFMILGTGLGARLTIMNRRPAAGSGAAGKSPALAAARG